jgi:hypothetical protein
MQNEVYMSWLITSTISLFLSLVMMIRILSNSQLRSKIFHQLMLLLVTSEIFISLSWFLGNKSQNSYLLCSFQEYLLQLGFLFRAGITVILCYLSTLMITSLIIPTWKHIFQILFLCLLFILATLTSSIYFQTANLFCYENPTQGHELRYATFVLAPIYCCLVFDLILYLYLRAKVYQFYHPSSSSSSILSPSSALFSSSPSSRPIATVPSATTAAAANMSNLLNVSHQLLRYPLLYALLLFPDVLYGLYVFVTKQTNLYFSIIASSSMGITGALLALRYIFRHDPSLLSLAPVLYSSQIQDLFRFTTTFSSTNYSFRKQQTTGPLRRGDGGMDRDGGAQSLPSSFIERYRYDSSNLSVLSHGTDASPPVQSTHRSHISGEQQTKLSSLDTTAEGVGASRPRGRFWSPFYSTSSNPSGASFEFTHSRSMSGASDRQMSPLHENEVAAPTSAPNTPRDPNTIVLSALDFL